MSYLLGIIMEIQLGLSKYGPKTVYLYILLSKHNEFRDSKTIKQYLGYFLIICPVYWLYLRSLTIYGRLSLS